MAGVVVSPGQLSPFWQNRPTLVTGATGFLGGWLVRRLLDRGAEVVCLVRDWVPQSELISSGLHERVKLAHGEVQDQGLMERVLGEYEIDTVFHLAAQTIVGIANRNPISTFASNIGGTWAILEACRRSPKVRQIVLASSDKAYGEYNGKPYKEDHPLQGRFPYDVSKSCADLIARSYAVTFGLPVAITRCGNFFGGGDLNWNRLVPGTIRSVLCGQRPLIRSDGRYVRDYLYVEDAAAAYMLLAEKLATHPELRGQAFNFAHDATLTVLELVQRILRLMGSDLSPDVRNEADNEIHCQYLDASKAREALHWTPLFSLDAALEKTIAWYESFLGCSG
jgi:CDP-glucose 4,6-dehydratase